MPLDFADQDFQGKTIPLDQINFMRLAETVANVFRRVTSDPETAKSFIPGVPVEQLAGLAVAQEFSEYLREVAG